MAEIIKENELEIVTSLAGTDYVRVLYLDGSTLKSARILKTNLITGGGGLNEFQFRPENFHFPSSNPAPLDTIAGSNVTVKCLNFDNSVNTSVYSSLILPGSIEAGDVTFEVWGIPVTAAANDVVFDFKHSFNTEGIVTGKQKY